MSRSRKKINAIVLRHRGLVKYIAKQYLGCGVPLEDLVGVGNLGLIWAAEDYDPRKAEFSVFATPRIKRFILDAIEDRDTIRIPKSRHWDRIKVLRAYDRLTQKLGREPSVEELSAETDMAANRTEIALRALQAPHKRLFNTSSGMIDNEWNIYTDKAPLPDEQLDQKQKTELINKIVIQLLDSLDEKDAAIIRSRFGIGKETGQTYEDIGKTMGYSKERIRQREIKALCELRERLRKMGVIAIDF